MRFIIGVSFVLMLSTACRTPAPADGSESSASPAAGDSKPVTMETIYLMHTYGPDWEPGDARFVFPVAGETFYGYFTKFPNTSVVVSDNCKSSLSVEKLASGYELSCAPNGDINKTVRLSVSSTTSTHPDDNISEYVTSFKFAPFVTLKKQAEGKYVLAVEPPAQ